MINLILLDPTIVIRTTPIAPVIWYERNGISFQDLKYDRFDEAIEFLKQNYIPYDTLCRSVDLTNRKDWIDEICAAIRFLLKNDCSIIAVEKSTNKIVGVVVMTVMRQEHRSWLDYGTHQSSKLNWVLFLFWKFASETLRLFWDFFVRRTEITRKIFGFQCAVMQDYLHENKRAIVDVSLHISIASIARCMKGKLFKEDLILQAAKVARSIAANSISYIATSNNDIERGRRVGFKVCWQWWFVWRFMDLYAEWLWNRRRIDLTFLIN